MSRVTAGWSAIETSELEKLLMKELETGNIISKSKLQQKFPTKSLSAIMAKKRHQLNQLKPKTLEKTQVQTK
jgi:hypothetical protein